MPQNIPVIDLDGDEALDAVRAGVEQIGLVQVVNHGIDTGLIDEFSRRAGQLLSRPRAE